MWPRGKARLEVGLHGSGLVTPSVPPTVSAVNRQAQMVPRPRHPAKSRARCREPSPPQEPRVSSRDRPHPRAPGGTHTIGHFGCRKPLHARARPPAPRARCRHDGRLQSRRSARLGGLLQDLAHEGGEPWTGLHGRAARAHHHTGHRLVAGKGLLPRSAGGRHLRHDVIAAAASSTCHSR